MGPRRKSSRLAIRAMAKCNEMAQQWTKLGWRIAATLKYEGVETTLEELKNAEDLCRDNGDEKGVDGLYYFTKFRKEAEKIMKEEKKQKKEEETSEWLN